MMRFVLTCVLALTALACEEEQGPVHDVVRDRPLEPDGSWASGPWPWLADDPDAEGLIEIAPESRIRLFHGLGRVPNEVHCYVGFSTDATWIMPSAGNACEIRDLDAESLTVRNGSGGSFFYRIVLR
jgi:hypothetical protein